jgi:tripartite-type tricarboxylate transporter receptor subunit TctC
MTATTRSSVLAGVLLAASLSASLAFAQVTTAPAYPTKPIRIISPGPPGSITDVASRQLADKLGPALGQPVITEYKVGAGGAIALEATAKSAPDGYTLVIANFVQLTINPSMYERVPYDPMKDFAPVILLYTAPLLLVAHPSLPANSLPELIQLAKAQPGKLFYGSTGNGLPPHIYTELFKFTAGIDLVHVPYKGGVAATTALVAGEVSVLMESASGVLPQVKSGRIKALAVTGDQRIGSLPDVPTFSEAGVPGIGVSWVGILAPAGTAPAVIERLNREFARALESPEVKAYYDAAGRTVVASSPEEFARVIRDEIPKWRAVVKQAGIKPG